MRFQKPYRAMGLCLGLACFEIFTSPVRAGVVEEFESVRAELASLLAQNYMCESVPLSAPGELQCSIKNLCTVLEPNLNNFYLYESPRGKLPNADLLIKKFAMNTCFEKKREEEQDLNRTRESENFYAALAKTQKEELAQERVALQEKINVSKTLLKDLKKSGEQLTGKKREDFEKTLALQKEELDLEEKAMEQILENSKRIKELEASRARAQRSEATVIRLTTAEKLRKQNGVSLSPVEVLLKQRSLIAAFSFRKQAIPLMCMDGVWIHQIQIGKAPAKIEEGCISDPRFNILYKSHAYLGLK